MRTTTWRETTSTRQFLPSIRDRLLNYILLATTLGTPQRKRTLNPKARRIFQNEDGESWKPEHDRLTHNSHFATPQCIFNTPIRERTREELTEDAMLPGPQNDDRLAVFSR
jgi:hypothetical protein